MNTGITQMDLVRKLLTFTASRGNMPLHIEQDRGRLLALCELVEFSRYTQQRTIGYDYLRMRRDHMKRIATRNFDAVAQGSYLQIEEIMEELSHSTDVLDGDPGGTGVITP